MQVDVPCQLSRYVHCSCRSSVTRTVVKTENACPVVMRAAADEVGGEGTTSGTDENSFQIFEVGQKNDTLITSQFGRPVSYVESMKAFTLGPQQSGR